MGVSRFVHLGVASENGIFSTLSCCIDHPLRNTALLYKTVLAALQSRIAIAFEFWHSGGPEGFPSTVLAPIHGFFDPLNFPVTQLSVCRGIVPLLI